MTRALIFLPAICLLILFAYLDRLLLKVKPNDRDLATLLAQARIALWGVSFCVLASAIVYYILEGK